jgi:molybdopterin-biosynthesis enzyme MoeA-like protein
VVPDISARIADEIERWSGRVDHVVTTGGVGPTHDDITMESIAAAFDLPVVPHPELVQLLREKAGEDYNDDIARMAAVPEGAVLWWDGDLFFPVVVIRNVCIFPGVPTLFQRKFNEIAHRFEGVPVHSVRLLTEQREGAIAATLRAAQERWPSVSIGSYPRLETRPSTVMVILDSRDASALEACAAHLRTQIEIKTRPGPSG